MKTKQELIAGLIESNDTRVLDIGYAQEPNTFLKNSSRQVYGVDIVIPQDLEPGYAKVVKVDLNCDRLPFDDGFFDVVVIGCTLAHVGNPLSVLFESNRVLKESGKIIITSPNPHYYWEVIMNVFFDFFKERVARAKLDEHFYSFSRFDMFTILTRAGFKISNEFGYLFALVKTPLRFNPRRFPGLAYEIIYVASKIAVPQNYTTFQRGGNGGKGERVDTRYDNRARSSQ